MQVIINDNLKIVEFWLASDEVLDKGKIKEHSKKKYSSIVYRSGNQDFFDNTVGLLKNNLQLALEKN